jgi:formylglycine-generating enzyme required for sulfatase activity
MLRRVRLLLPVQQADVGTEFDAWNHQEAAFTADAMAVRGGNALRRRAAFSRLDADLKLSIAKIIRDVHSQWSVTFFARETLSLKECGAAVPAEDVEQARRILRRINRTMFDIVARDPNRAQILRLFEWQQADWTRCSSAARATSESAVAWALSRTWRGEETCVVPDEIDRDEVARTQERLLADGSGPTVWQIGRTGPELTLVRGSIQPFPCSPVASITAEAPRFDLALAHEDGGGSLLNLLPQAGPGQLRVSVSMARHLTLRSDRGDLNLEMMSPPPWATRFGWDRRGMFADFSLKGVTFSLRWIPPGEFEMGSPDDEPGRWEAEGPQHRVTVGNGFWLGATPVTQGQYAAVTGKRPSLFEHAGDEAPVEQVGWDDCRKFCQTLTKSLPELEAGWAFRLPTEAEWEYACRAGTTTALYNGPLTIEGERNGPELDAIAWYGGNSGVDYEGGFDSSGWPEKQYDHQRAGTHPVRQKEPNAWGLYDMLGNVWEWCEDVWHDNYEGAPSDGTAWGGKGRDRVLRGGSWAPLARYCRCAYRFSWEPGSRLVSLGFRLVLAARSAGGSGRSLELGDVRRHGRSGRTERSESEP